MGARAGSAKTNPALTAIASRNVVKVLNRLLRRALGHTDSLALLSAYSSNVAVPLPNYNLYIDREWMIRLFRFILSGLDTRKALVLENNHLVPHVKRTGKENYFAAASSESIAAATS